MSTSASDVLSGSPHNTTYDTEAILKTLTLEYMQQHGPWDVYEFPQQYIPRPEYNYFPPTLLLGAALTSSEFKRYAAHKQSSSSRGSVSNEEHAVGKRKIPMCGRNGYPLVERVRSKRNTPWILPICSNYSIGKCFPLEECEQLLDDLKDFGIKANIDWHLTEVLPEREKTDWSKDYLSMLAQRHDGGSCASQDNRLASGSSHNTNDTEAILKTLTLEYMQQNGPWDIYEFPQQYIPRPEYNYFPPTLLLGAALTSSEYRRYAAHKRSSFSRLSDEERAGGKRKVPSCGNNGTPMVEWVRSKTNTPYVLPICSNYSIGKRFPQDECDQLLDDLEEFGIKANVDWHLKELERETTDWSKDYLSMLAQRHDGGTSTLQDNILVEGTRTLSL